MYYELSEFYKRDVCFIYDEQANTIDKFDFDKGEVLTPDKPLVFSVGRIDNYINTYDILPTIGPPLVSARFKSLIEQIAPDDVSFHESIIIDEKQNQNDQFWVLNVLNVVECLDKDRSIYEIEEDGFYDIEELVLLNNPLGTHQIVRMKEDFPIIIVDSSLKKQCEKLKFKGIDFIDLKTNTGEL